MPVQITVSDPEYYMQRLSAGCILDPSVFYSDQYVEATIEVISAAKPGGVYLPSNLYAAIKKGSWTSFLTTLTLWSGHYERIPDAWRKREALVSQLDPSPIQIPEPDERTRPIFDALADGGVLSPLHQSVFELTAYSYMDSIPIFVGSRSRFRLLELLSHRLQTIIVEPVGQWAAHKKQYLAGRRLRISLFALGLMGGAFVFVESVQRGSVMGMGAAGSIVAATVIDSSA